MTSMGRREYLRAIHGRYQRSKPAAKGTILDEFCSICGYHRKYAIRLLGQPCPEARPGPRRSRGPSYSRRAIEVLVKVWEAAGYPWSDLDLACLGRAQTGTEGLRPALRQTHQIKPRREAQVTRCVRGVRESLRGVRRTAGAPCRGPKVRSPGPRAR